jgi:hypothetical protein
MNITDTIKKYTRGEATLEETNAALREMGADVYLDPAKNTIHPDEVDRFGLLDTGTGSLDKVEVKDGKLVNADCGEMTAFCIFGGKMYAVNGDTLVAE